MGQAQDMAVKRVGFQKKGLPEGVNFPLCLAPMVGLSHYPLRQLVREYLPQGATTLWPSEMLNSRRIPHERLQKIPEAMSFGDENFWMPQILANQENEIAQSVEKLFPHGAQGVDINMGCPVKKALRHNYGVALMGDRKYAAEVVRVAVKHSPGPVSVKLRAVGESKKREWMDFALGLEGAGASWLCLHPRTPEQKRRGQADWQQIKELVDLVKVPVIGNGDIQVVHDITDMLEQTGCDMVMAGRGLTARPWLMWQLGEKLGWGNPLGKKGAPPKTSGEEGVEYGKSLSRLLDLMEETLPQPLALRKFLFHVQTSSVWIPFGHTLFSKISGARTFAEARAVLKKFFSYPHEMSTRTELRQ